MTNHRSFITVGALGAIAVALGAFGAHTLRNQLSTGLITQDQLAGFDTGVKYQMYHTLAMALLVLLKYHFNHKFLTWAWWCFLTGIILFSGSLYFLCTRNLYGAEFLRFLGPVTPLGGLCFMAGWILIMLAGMRRINN
jgi:uncharacterized membrane protein YgdD (TMEM256/DUF423 family)